MQDEVNKKLAGALCTQQAMGLPTAATRGSGLEQSTG